MAEQNYLEDPKVREVIANVNASHNRLPVDQVLAVLHESLRSVTPDRQEPIPHPEVTRIAEQISEGTWKQV
ncbi:hypothetical protein [Desertivibrio insolitus]|uniref:hypothetical protein n=1 Tax=Herbiconiux sp. SYSU D00978 TaxID=2812562 RepID=UPI001A97A890|nr:hypothetical protein [Herbiconiux sp. SYSU D00978]